MTSVVPDLYEFDEIRITGTSGSGRRYVDLRGTVATVSKDGSVKLWPDDDPQLSDDDRAGGKVWFEVGNIESATVLLRET